MHRFSVLLQTSVYQLCFGSQLAVSIGNAKFNDIMEINLPNDAIKPLPKSDMWVLLCSLVLLLAQTFFLTSFWVLFAHLRTARKEYIVAKYAERRYVLPKEHSEAYHVYDAARSKDLTSLLQLYAEGEDLSKPVATPEGQVRSSIQPYTQTQW